MKKPAVAPNRAGKRSSWPALGLVGAAGSLPIVGWIGGRHWFLDLFNHFQAQYFVFLLLCGAILALRRRFVSAAVAGLFLITPGIRLLPLWLPPAPEARPTLQFASFNVLGHNDRHADTLDWIRRERPDIVYLCEPTTDWAEALKPLSEEYPHTVERPLRGNLGFLFFSRFPLRDTEVSLLGRIEIPLLDTTVDAPGGPIRVFGAHPVPPVSGFWQTEHAIYMQALAEAAGRSEGPAVILGDLNATRWGHRMAPLFAAGFRDSARGHGYAATWSRHNPLVAVPIDHVLSRDLGPCVDHHLGPELGSDHRPVIAGFRAPQATELRTISFRAGGIGKSSG